jgi:hypothetical protein
VACLKAAAFAAAAAAPSAPAAPAAIACETDVEVAEAEFSSKCCLMVLATNSASAWDSKAMR